MTADPAATAAPASADAAMADRPLLVWIDQDLCTGDGLCVQYARSVFEMDLDGLAYVKDSVDELMTDPGARTPVPSDLVADVIASARECPGACIHVERAEDGVEIVGPNAIENAATPKG